MGQEHWLTERQIPSISSLGTQFVARSGMEDAISSQIYKGRPFGGVCIAWSPVLDQSMKPLSNFRHKRIVGVEFVSDNEKIIFITAYMPFFDSSKREQCMSETIDAIAMIDTIISEHHQHNVVIGGDLNSELKGASPFDTLWEDLMKKFDLRSCDSFISCANPYTYSHDSLGQRKWSDHFIVSNSLCEKMSNHAILDEGDNTSDHRPITFHLSVSLTAASTRTEDTVNSSNKLKWEKLSYAELQSYQDRLRRLTDNKPPTAETTCPEAPFLAPTSFQTPYTSPFSSQASLFCNGSIV